MGENLQESDTQLADEQECVAQPPLREDVLAAINYEIDRLRDELRRPGWTSWAMIAAIAAIAWYTVAHFEPVRLVPLLAIIFVAVSAYDILSLMRVTIFFDLQKRRVSKRFWNPHVVASSHRPLILYYAAASLCMAVIPVALAPLLGWPLSALVSIIYFLAATIRVLSLVSSYMGYPIPAGVSAKVARSRAIPFIATEIAILLLFASAFLLYLLNRYGQFPELSEMRVASAVLVTAFLLKLWLDGLHSQNAISHLCVLRRELALKSVSINEAKRLLEASVLGMDTLDTVWDISGAVLRRFGSMRSRLDEIENAINEVSSKLEENSIGKLDSDMLVLYLGQVNRQRIAVLESAGHVQRDISRWKRRVRAVQKSGGDKEVIADTARAMDSAFQELDERYKQAVVELEALVRQLAKHDIDTNQAAQPEGRAGT